MSDKFNFIVAIIAVILASLLTWLCLVNEITDSGQFWFVTISIWGLGLIYVILLILIQFSSIKKDNKNKHK